MKQFWDKVAFIPGHECWEWVAEQNHQGYGRVRFNGPKKMAHRVSYELTYGPIPTGLIVRHKCDNPSCVRPEHLELGTHRDNTRDMFLRGRDKDSRGSDPRTNISHCKRGHRFDEENTRWYRGHRYCTPCQRIHDKISYQKKKEAR